MRIVANIAVDATGAARRFYGDFLGMRVAMDLGWIVTFAFDAGTTPQMSVTTEGGAGTPVPDISIEVENLSEVYERAVSGGFRVEYGRRMSLGVSGASSCAIPPAGRLLNVLAHVRAG